MHKALSPQDLLSCDAAGWGCKGGDLASAWAYLNATGAVADKCAPYAAGNGTLPACRRPRGKHCGRHHAGGAYAVSTVEGIQREVMANGPVAAGLRVYKSLLAYDGGVYRKVPFHATISNPSVPITTFSPGPAS